MPETATASGVRDTLNPGAETSGETWRGLEPHFEPDVWRRVQACVQACEGFSTAELEAGILVQMKETLIKVAPLLERALGRKS